jgi:hypothetical protein
MLTVKQCYNRGLSPSEAAKQTGLLVRDIEDAYDFLDMQSDLDTNDNWLDSMSEAEVMAMADYYHAE